MVHHFISPWLVAASTFAGPELYCMTGHRISGAVFAGGRYGINRRNARFQDPDAIISPRPGKVCGAAAFLMSIDARLMGIATHSQSF